MRRALALAAVLALCAGPALAQYSYVPDQHGVVGSIVTANDPGGNPRKVALPKFICDSGCASPTAWTPKLLNGLSAPVVTVKASAGTFGFIQCYNPNSTVAYVQILDSASPTLGTTAPVQSVAIAPSATGGYAPSGGVTFSTAIKVAATTTATGSTAPTTALDCNAGYN